MAESLKNMAENTAENMRKLAESTRHMAENTTETTESVEKCLAVVQGNDAALQVLLGKMAPFLPQKVDSNLTESVGRDLGSMEHSKVRDNFYAVPRSIIHSLMQHIIPVTFSLSRCAFYL